MSKTVKRVLLVLLAVVLIGGCSLVGVTLAAPQTTTITYDCAQHSLEVSENAIPFFGDGVPDLFANLKDLMPGDWRNQEIKIQIKNSAALQGGTVKLYLYAKVPDDGLVKNGETVVNNYEKLIEKNHYVTFDIKLAGSSIKSELDATIADPTLDASSLNELVYLGEYSASKMEQTLDVSLIVDRAAGNDLQNLVAVVDWYLYAVETEAPETPNPPSPPNPPIEDLTYIHINYIIGYTDGTVRPEGYISRAEAAAILYRLLTDEALADIWSTQQFFPDVQPGAWYYMYVSTLANGGILTGYPDGNFYPDSPITRAEMATMLSRFDSGFGKIEVNATFPDIQGHWAQKYVEFAAERKYVNGYPNGTFQPNSPITRAETVRMINRCLQRSVDEQGLSQMDGYVNFPDNNPGRWYYYDIIEAANYHDYVRSTRPVEEQDYKQENWTKLMEPIDWATVERQWLHYPTGSKEFITPLSLGW